MFARLPHLLVPTSFLVGAGLFAVAGCSSSSVPRSSITHPTMIEVSPENFLGEVPCATDGPGLKRYVATLFDVDPFAGGSGGGPGASSGQNEGGGTSGAAPFRLPSSGPTRCQSAVGFGFVVPERLYRVELDGYDTDDLTPRALGAREMVHGELVLEPSWHASCERAIAVESTIVRADRCSSFTSGTPDAAGSVTIKLSTLLGQLRCGSNPGEVDHFEVSLVPAAGEQPQIQSVACAEDARAVFEQLAPRQLVSVSVTAFDAEGSSAFAGATCSARTLPAANVDAACAALNQTGTLRVDLSAALALLELACDSDELGRLEIRVPGDDQPEVVTPAACSQPFERGFGPGPAALSVTALEGSAAPFVELGSVTCHAEMTPGQLVRAECELNSAD